MSPEEETEDARKRATMDRYTRSVDRVPMRSSSQPASEAAVELNLNRPKHWTELGGYAAPTYAKDIAASVGTLPAAQHQPPQHQHAQPIALQQPPQQYGQQPAPSHYPDVHQQTHQYTQPPQQGFYPPDVRQMPAHLGMDPAQFKLAFVTGDRPVEPGYLVIWATPVGDIATSYHSVYVDNGTLVMLLDNRYPVVNQFRPRADPSITLQITVIDKANAKYRQQYNVISFGYSFTIGIIDQLLVEIHEEQADEADLADPFSRQAG